MTTLGIGLVQSIRDHYEAGIQRVLQQVALRRPAKERADFFVPSARDTSTLNDVANVADLLMLPFEERSPGVDLRTVSDVR